MPVCNKTSECSAELGLFEVVPWCGFSGSMQTFPKTKILD